MPRETGSVFRQIETFEGLFHGRAVREPWASHRAFVPNPRRQHPSRQSGHIHPRNVSEPAKLSTVDVELNRMEVQALQARTVLNMIYMSAVLNTRTVRLQILFVSGWVGGGT